MQDLSPIVLFTYNRPYHTEQTLSALMKNDLADQSTLYIYCDGAKEDATSADIEKIKEVRQIVRKEKWCAEVHIIESEKNKGLANSIIGGVSEVINKFGKVIVLEDDLITSPFFLRFMNESLNFYSSYPSVFSISANRPPVSKMKIPDDYNYDVFVSLRSYSTGWATWKEKWDKVDWEMKKFNSILKSKFQREALKRAGDDFVDLIKMQQEGKIDSWAVRFGLEHFVQHSVAILPCVSFVDNIGFDGSGTHSGKVEDLYRNDLLLAKSDFKFLDVIYEDSRIINAFYNVFTYKKRPLWQKIINRLCRTFNKENVFVIKKRIYF